MTVRQTAFSRRVRIARAAANTVSNKWKPEIIVVLYDRGPLRYTDLLREIGCHNKVLSDMLSELCTDGLCSRSEAYYDVPLNNELMYGDTARRICIEYELTQAGRDMIPVFDRIINSVESPQEPS